MTKPPAPDAPENPPRSAADQPIPDQSASAQPAPDSSAAPVRKPRAPRKSAASLEHAGTGAARPTSKPRSKKAAEAAATADTPAAPELSGHDLSTFNIRLERYRQDLENSLRAVYGKQVDALWPRLEALLRRALAERPADLKRLDEARLLRPDWLQVPEMIGYVAYTDRFAGTLRGVSQRLGYLEELGVKYLHLMPLLKPRARENDGGYAVADYRAVREDLGSIDDLRSLTAELRGRGISLELDLVINHVAREHDWAVRARAGEARYRDYFLLFPDRQMPDAYERSLPEIFPDFAPGNFTWNEEAASWVWTTFNSYQWDLNWANPDVFLEFVDIILYLANQGVEIFRLDAIAFLWKRLGTDSQNQPEVHDLTRALRACARIVAPAVAFKAEAIVSPGDLIAYLGKRDHSGKVSDMAYHNSLMVQLWSSLASRNTRLFEQALSAFAPKPTNTTWGLYVRCHDDIGWAISDHDAGMAGTVGWGHRAFLSDFYSGEWPGSFARGQVFQANPRTGDRRISGSAASLAGLEAAQTPEDVSLALRRLRLLHAVTLGYGGVPLLYMGDELALTNDYSYQDVPEHASDNRWLHRPAMDWDKAEERADSATPAGQMYAALQQLIRARQQLPHLHASIESQVVRSSNEHTLLLRRSHPLGQMLGVYNFTGEFQPLPAWVLREVVGDFPRDAISGHEWNLTNEEVALEPYGAYWLIEQPR
ncbi:amylosucrase [Deinococcus rubellus]|uniref:Alpha-amylase family glycosyl hydrolase n=1 Tax=Deinococcus rubellus TaxID=1889240 RepID=A0ABY5YHE6_9DEIO|nr:alpha-amylase family glycosyl hydrolase [Deinococcus rubellus]UWX63699.1 alpha-amylase family glycosyl hydrolase [Deinococcus rubellus]